MDPSQTNSADSWILPRLTQLTPAFMTGNMKKGKGGEGQVSYGKVYMSIGTYC